MTARTSHGDGSATCGPHSSRDTGRPQTHPPRTKLGPWIKRGGVRQQQTGGTRFPAPVIFGHFALDAIGLVVWIIYLVADKSGLAWTALGVGG